MTALAVGAVAIGALATEGAIAAFGDFFVSRPLEAGFVSGVLLSLVISVAIKAVIDSVHSSKWNALAAAAFEALAHEVTIVVDTLNSLVTGYPPSDPAAPTAGTADELAEVLWQAGLEPVDPDVAHALAHEVYVARLELLVGEGFSPPPDETGWCLRAQNAIIALRVGYRNGLGRWAAALVATGELADVLERLALLNQRLSAVEEWVRLRRGASGWNDIVSWTPEAVATVWTDALGEALSVREDLWRAAKGGSDPVWAKFRNPARAEIRDAMAERAAAAAADLRVRRRVVSEPIAAPMLAHPRELAAADQRASALSAS